MILLTGGAGFIGSNLLRELNRLNINDVWVVDRLRHGVKWKNLNGASFAKFSLVEDFKLEKDYFKNIKFIFHIGASSSTTETNVDYLMRNNFEFSKKLFLLASELQIPIIYASSAATYGNGDMGYSDSHEKVSSLRPLNPYGFSKQLFDLWVLQRVKDKKNLPPFWCGLKFFNVFGPYEDHKQEMRSMVHKAFEQIKLQGKVKLFKSHREDFEDGNQKRDFISVRDIVRAMLAFFNNASFEYSGIYNLGTGKSRTFNDLVSSVFASLNEKPKIEYIDMPEALRRQYQYFTEADMSKFIQKFPEFTFSTLEESIDDYIKNYLKENFVPNSKDNKFASSKKSLF